MANDIPMNAFELALVRQGNPVQASQSYRIRTGAEYIEEPPGDLVIAIWTDDQLEAANSALQAIYSLDRGGAGCCLHIVTDDHNLNDSSVQVCVDSAIERQHPYCLAMARMLLTMTKTERERAVLFHYDEATRRILLTGD